MSRLPAFLAVLWLACCLPATAQRSAILSGHVTDPSAAAVAGAEVLLVAPDGSVRRTVTDARGRYEFTDAVPGDYVVRARAAGLRPAECMVRLPGGGSVTADLPLALPTVAETITVSEVTEQARATLERTPGGIALVTETEISRARTATLKDVMAFTPGVLVQPRFGSDESQLSIRGSGLRNNFHLRGVNILVNRIPYEDADGSSDLESLELMATQRIEVWKGANALEQGGRTMGGAINFVTETGETASPLQVRLEGGAFGYWKAQAAGGGTRGPLSYFTSFSHSDFDGYRRHSAQGRQRLFANLSYAPAANTRVGLDAIYANVAERLPGSLTRAEFESDPRQANPANLAGRWGRFYNLARLATTLQQRLGQGQELSVRVYGQYRTMDHPIFQVLDQDARNFGVELHYSFAGELAGRRNRLTVGYAPQHGTVSERRFANVNGERGPLVNRFGTSATNHGFYFENQTDIIPALTVSFGGRSDWAARRFDDRFPGDGDRSDQRRFSSFSPKLGFVWRAAEGAQVFGNVSRSYEPPLLLELTSFGAPGFLPLRAQDTWQFEIGTRGGLGARATWDVAFFDAEIRDEIINLNLQPFPGAPFTVPSYRNVPRTRHLGLEAGWQSRLASAVLRPADRLDWRSAYTWSRFHFTDDPDFRSHRLPGAPHHLLRSELRYESGAGFWLAPNVDWSPARYFVDSANTTSNHAYAVLNLRSGYDWRRVGVYVEGANLANRRYSASVQVDNALGRFYEPANGRSFYAGLRWRY